MINVKQILQGYYYWIKYYTNKEYRKYIKQEAKRRIKICEACEYFWKPARNCMICGCLMDVKCKMDFKLDENGKSINGCYEKRW